METTDALDIRTKVYRTYCQLKDLYDKLGEKTISTDTINELTKAINAIARAYTLEFELTESVDVLKFFGEYTHTQINTITTIVEKSTDELIKNLSALTELLAIISKLPVSVDKLSILNNNLQQIKLLIDEAYSKLKPILKESKMNTGTEYYCVMLRVYPTILNWNEIISSIPSELLYLLPGFGLETNPHITLLYGIEPYVNIEEIIETVKKLPKFDKMKVGNCSYFHSTDYEILKYDINNWNLIQANMILTKLPHITTHPIYNPHLTVGYLKKNKNLDLNYKNFEINPVEILISGPSDVKYIINI